MTDRFVHPQEAHQVPVAHLLYLVPQLHGGDPGLLTAARQGLAKQILQLCGHGSWQEAWNDWVGATEESNGWLDITYMGQCPDCHGTLIDMRRGRACLRCMGRRQVLQTVRTLARYAEPPQD